MVEKRKRKALFSFFITAVMVTVSFVSIISLNSSSLNSQTPITTSHSANVLGNQASQRVLSNFVSVGYNTDLKLGVTLDKDMLLNSLESQSKVLRGYMLKNGLDGTRYSLGATINYTTDNITLYLTKDKLSGNNIQQSEIHVSETGGAQKVEHSSISVPNVIHGKSGNWDGYGFQYKNFWQQLQEINWVSEGVTMPTDQSPPNPVSGVPSDLSSWDGLMGDSKGSTMVQAGWDENYPTSTQNGGPYIWYQVLSNGNAQPQVILPGQSQNPIHHGDYMYIAVEEKSTSTYYVVITDTANGINYESNVFSVPSAFHPYYAASVTETPQFGSNWNYYVAQSPKFGNFQVNSINFYSDGNTYTGSYSWDRNWYSYSYLQ